MFKISQEHLKNLLFLVTNNLERQSNIFIETK